MNPRPTDLDWNDKVPRRFAERTNHTVSEHFGLMRRRSRCPVRVRRSNSTVTIYKSDRKKNGRMCRDFELVDYGESESTDSKVSTLSRKRAGRRTRPTPIGSGR
jgi:hypothetical protein